MGRVAHLLPMLALVHRLVHGGVIGLLLVIGDSAQAGVARAVVRAAGLLPVLAQVHSVGE